MKSDEAIALGTSRMKVYGLINTSKKSENSGSLYQSSAGSEKELLDGAQL